MRTCSLSFPNLSILLHLCWKQMKSIIILPINGEYNCNCGAVKHWAQRYSSNTKQNASIQAFLCWVAKRNTEKTDKTTRWRDRGSERCSQHPNLEKNINLCGRPFSSSSCLSKDREQQKGWGGFLMPPHVWDMGAPWHNHANAITVYTGPMARGPTLKPPPWECDSVLVWQPLTAAESQSGHLRHLKVKCFHGKFEDPSSSLI